MVCIEFCFAKSTNGGSDKKQVLSARDQICTNRERKSKTNRKDIENGWGTKSTSRNSNVKVYEEFVCSRITLENRARARRRATKAVYSDVRAGLGLKARAWAGLSRARACEYSKPGLKPKPAQARPYQGPKAGLCLLASPGPLKPGPSPGF